MSQGDQPSLILGSPCVIILSSILRQPCRPQGSQAGTMRSLHEHARCCAGGYDPQLVGAASANTCMGLLQVAPVICYSDTGSFVAARSACPRRVVVHCSPNVDTPERMQATPTRSTSMPEFGAPLGHGRRDSEVTPPSLGVPGLQAPQAPDGTHHSRMKPGIEEET